MMFSLFLKSLARGKARLSCAVAGVSAAVGAVVFMFSLSSTNSAQAPALAKRAAAPWAAWEFDGDKGRTCDLALELVRCTIDYRPGGRVLQGPPMRAVVAAAPKKCPYDTVRLEEGRWVDDSSADFEVVCTKNTLKRFGRGTIPPIGTAIKFVGGSGTVSARIVGYLSETELPPFWPGVFANKAAFKTFSDEKRGTLSFWKSVPPHSEGRRSRDPAKAGVLTPESETVVNGFKGDENRRMDYAKPLMLIAAVLTALCLLVNSLLLSVEANRRNLAVLRVVGLTRAGVCKLIAIEALVSTFVGWVLGSVFSLGALVVYVASDATAFPTGPAVAWNAVAATLALTPLVSLGALSFAVWPALSVRPLDALEARPRRRRRGMAIAFACGFGAFVAVEVWGASLMRAFVPSEEWPDAIVSVLPDGTSSFDVEKLRDVPGVKRISELYPLQLDFEPAQPIEMRGGRGARGRRSFNRNVLFLAAEWLPRFKFLEGTWEEADAAIRSSDACVITEMMSRARNLHKGDMITVAIKGRGPKTVVKLPIAGVVDLNWHMVTSRGLVRGLRGAPVMTDGPAFVSLDTIESLDPRPAFTVRMTHLWVDYQSGFLKEKGVFGAGRAVEASIAKRLGMEGASAASTVRLHARDEIADGTLAHGSDVIGQAARVPFVFLAVLSIGFIAMLVADADAARRSFTVLRAVGATRAQLVARLARGALKTAFWGIVAGLPAGAVVGWLFSLGTGSIWPGLPHYFRLPVQIVAEGALGALVFVLAFALPSAWTLIARRGTSPRD